jgi:glyoxylase-like metal-dependent hydrolase (beta-lactamase superfamily II)
MKNLYVATAALAGALMVSTGASAADVAKSADIAYHGLEASDFPRWHQIEPNVYAYEDTLTTPSFTFTTNSLIIVTSDGVVLVDGQDHEEQGDSLVNAIKEITRQPLKYVVIASDHGDHVNALPIVRAAFPKAIYISSPASLKTMTDLKRPIVATELVDDQRTLKLGETEIRILNLGRGHTGGDLVVYLPETKVMFLSELYDRNIFPPMVTGYPTEWVATLKKAQAMDVKWFVPGHGFTVGSPAELKADLADFTKAVELVASEGKRLRAVGVPCPTEKDCPANAQANWEHYGGFTAAAGQAPRALARAYAEIDGKLPK